MTEWQRIAKFGTARVGLECWKRPICHSRSVAVSVCGHWFRFEWEWIW